MKNQMILPKPFLNEVLVRCFPGKVTKLPKLKYLVFLLMGVCSVQFAAREAGSCSAPVFRYALERWKPDPYKGIYIHRGVLTDKDQVMLGQLEKAASFDSDFPLNLQVRDVDIETFSEERLTGILKGPIPPKLPALAIWYPEQMGKAAPLWMLEPTDAVLRALINSPKRKQLTEGLITGDSIAWVFVPSGNSIKDEKARTLIRKQSDLALSSLVKMPFFIMSGSKQVKLTYGFPILTISRTDPEERFFLDMLLNSESDLHEYKDEPMVFPVFGRGRMLGCLFGEYITEKNIQDVVSFLAASCSCDVKAMNPGTDLLLAALWDRVVMAGLLVEDDTPLPELTGVMPETPVAAAKTIAVSGTTETEAAAAAPITPVSVKKMVASSTEKPPEESRIFKIYGITLGSVAVVVVFASLIIVRRRKDN
jgi:hypothetical protein